MRAIDICGQCLFRKEIEEVFKKATQVCRWLGTMQGTINLLGPCEVPRTFSGNALAAVVDLKATLERVLDAEIEEYT